MHHIALKYGPRCYAKDAFQPIPVLIMFDYFLHFFHPHMSQWCDLITNDISDRKLKINQFMDI